MKIGTKSYLFGAHHWWHHSRYVIKAWTWLYGRRPRLAEVLAIFLHDIGYIGCADLDGPEGTTHPSRSAIVVRWVLGENQAHRVRRHSLTYCRMWRMRPSLLAWADKLGTALWLEQDRTGYLSRTRKTGELDEYRQVAALSGFLPAEECDELWAENLAQHVRRKAVMGAPGTVLSHEARKHRLEYSRSSA